MEDDNVPVTRRELREAMESLRIEFRKQFEAAFGATEKRQQEIINLQTQLLDRLQAVNKMMEARLDALDASEEKLREKAKKLEERVREFELYYMPGPGKPN